MKFRLLRHFAIASLLSIVVASIGLSVLQRQHALDEVMQLGEAANAEIARVMANVHLTPMRELLAAAATLPADALRARPQTAALHASIRSAVRGTTIVKIKVFSLDGRTVYSSEERQIGEDKSRNPGFAGARDGRVTTELTQRDHFSAFEKHMLDRSVLSTYLPYRTGASASIDAVLEVYQDVTPLLAHLDATQHRVVGGVVACLLLLYGALLLLVLRADRILVRQTRQGEADAAALRVARDELEQRVAQMRQVDTRRERYLALSKLSSDWFWDQDSEFRFIDLDSKGDELGGIHRSTHIGRTRWELPYTDPVSTTWALHQAELAAHRPFRNLLLRRSPPSGVRWVSVSGEPVFDADGSFAGYRGLASDVTERVGAETALAAAREDLAQRAAQSEHAAFLQALLDVLPVGVSLVGKDLAVVATNQACLRLLDLPDNVFCSGAALESVFRYNAERGDYGTGEVGALVAQRMVLARAARPHRFERMRPNGHTIEIQGLPLPDGSMVTAYTDITGHKRAERELVAARDAAEAGSHAKSSFLAVMSHEIRTPMNAVIGLLELLRLSPLDAEQRDTVDTVRESSKSLLRLIDDVLDFSKIEAGKLELQLEAASLPRMFESAYQHFGGVASQRGVLLTRRLDPRIAAAVFVDRLRLRQILNNLLSNAIKFTERGQVELTAELLGHAPGADRVRIQVRDTGVGIEPAAIERLFEPFNQANPGVERRYGGTGLGLAICKRLAGLMDAAIDIQSAPGVGTRIGLTLTLRHADAADLQHARPLAIETIAKALEGQRAPTVAAARGEGRLVLVVDDHPVNRNMMARQLNVLGYAVQTAADGREALAVRRGGGFGLVITDCQMPVMDGYQLARAIRDGEAGTPLRVPIVACTANVAQEALEECLHAGMDEAIAKPVELVALKQILDRWLPHAMPDPAEAPPPAPLESEFGAITELAQGDAVLKRELLDDFRCATVDDLACAARAVREVAIDDLRRAAHRIKGAARTVGASRLADAATRLERAALDGDWQRVSSAWAPLREEGVRLDERIAAKSGQGT